MNATKLPPMDYWARASVAHAWNLVKESEVLNLIESGWEVRYSRKMPV